MIIILLGTPASGKGTQAELLEKEFGFYHFSTGQMLREMKDQDPEISETMKKGLLVSDDKVLKLIEQFLEKHDLYNKEIIVDGSPRSLYQYQELKKLFKKHKKKIDLAIYLKVDESVSIKRLTARRENPKTGDVYNLITNPPGPEVDQSELIHREDDKEEAVRARLRAQKIPEDLHKALREDGILTEINGEQKINEVFKQIVNAIKNVKK